MVVNGNHIEQKGYFMIIIVRAIKLGNNSVI